MTNEQIRRELRRSACEDHEPFFECDYHAFTAAYLWLEDGDKRMSIIDDESMRTLFLLVAEALT